MPSESILTASFAALCTNTKRTQMAEKSVPVGALDVRIHGVAHPVDEADDKFLPKRCGHRAAGLAGPRKKSAVQLQTQYKTPTTSRCSCSSCSSSRGCPGMAFLRCSTSSGTLPQVILRKGLGGDASKWFKKPTFGPESNMDSGRI